MNHRCTLRIICLIFCAWGHQSLAQGNWELEKEDSGIKVYTKHFDGQAVKGFRGETVIKAPAASVASFLMDVKNKKQWTPDCESIDLLHSEADSSNFRMVIEMPWPFENRDIVISQTLIENQADQSTLVKFKTNNELVAETELPRISFTSGYYKLIAKENKTLVILESITDPGLKIPAWIINMKIVDTPFETLQNLRHSLELNR